MVAGDPNQRHDHVSILLQWPISFDGPAWQRRVPQPSGSYLEQSDGPNEQQCRESISTTGLSARLDPLRWSAANSRCPDACGHFELPKNLQERVPFGHCEG